MFAATGIAFACLLAADSSALAQPGFTFTAGQGLNSVAAATEASLGDAAQRQTTYGSLEAEHLAFDSRLRLYNEFDAGTFSTVGDWKYLLHNGGATYRLPLGESGGNSLYLGGSASWRRNGSSWAAADFHAVGMVANVEIKPRETVALRLGYRADIRSFSDLPELDQVQHDGFFSVLVNLPSRTTLIGETHVGAKSYAANSDSMPAITAGLPAQVSARPGGSGPWIGAGSMSAGMGPSLRRLGAGGMDHSQSNRAGQIVFLGRVAQSLADRTGVSLQCIQRSSFGEVPPVVVTTPALFFDDGIYDDPFASDSRMLSAGALDQATPVSGPALAFPPPGPYS